MVRILLLGAGTQALAISEDLHSSDTEVYMLCGEKHNYGDDSKYIKKCFYTNHTFEGLEILKKVKLIIQECRIDTIIPMGDVWSYFLSKNKQELLNYVSFEIPEIINFEKGYDKSNLMTICSQNDYPHPETQENISSYDDIDVSKLIFPLLIKPDKTCGGRGMTLVNSVTELKSQLPEITSKYGQCHLQRFIKPGGRQVEVQLYVDKNGDLKYSSVLSKFRWYPEKCGSSSCAESIENKEIVKTLHNLLKDIGWVGFADFDTIEDPDTHELLIMELNPRVPACIRCAIVSGIRWGEIIKNEYLNLPGKKYTYNTGKILKHIGFETLWFIKSKNRLKSKPNVLDFFGKNIFYQDLIGKDFKPFIWGTLKNLFKVIKNNKG